MNHTVSQVIQHNMYESKVHYFAFQTHGMALSISETQQCDAKQGFIYFQSKDCKMY